MPPCMRQCVRAIRRHTTLQAVPTKALATSESRDGDPHYATPAPDNAFRVKYDHYKSSDRTYKIRPSPSRPLEQAFRDAHMWWAVPPAFPHKLDLSYQSSRRRWGRRATAEKQSAAYNRRSGPTLQSILAEYTLSVFSAPDGAVRDGSKAANFELDDNQYDLLSTRGYSLDDVRLWYSILSCDDPISASRRIHASLETVQAESRPTPKSLPTFVLLFFLRRSHIPAEALRLLLVYLWDRVEVNVLASTFSDPGAGAADAPSSPSNTRLTDPVSLFILIVRLVRHARMVLPDALVSIVRLYTHCWHFPSKWHLASPSELTRTPESITHEHNILLQLLSYPTSGAPFANTASQEVAQFDLLGHMAEQRPTIPVNRIGFRAIARTQLVRPKTAQERDWASLKRPDWPPWKEDKMGFDSEKTASYGTSRALAAVKLARQAGYGDKTWERVATVLSGWDIDNTPTIQTRAWLLHLRVNRHASNTQDMIPNVLWAARIRSTRTAHESWALYLSLSNRSVRISGEVCLALIEKLAAEDDRQAKERSEIPSFSPARQNGLPLQGGDAREVLAPPTSEREGVYTRRPIPSMDEFAEEMRAAGRLPTGEMLAVLVKHAPSFAHAEKYVAWATQLYPSLQVLLPEQRVNHDLVKQVPKRILDAYVDRLFIGIGNLSWTASSSAQGQSDRLPAMLHRLARFQQFIDHPRMGNARSWHPILAALTSIESSTFSETNVKGVDEWRMVVLIRRWMKERHVALSNQILHSILCGAQNAIISAKAVDARKSGTDFSWAAQRMHIPEVKIFGSAEELRQSIGSYTRTLFFNFFGTVDARQVGRPGVKTAHVPALLARPTGSILLEYIRVQGLLCNHHHIVECVRWMVLHKEAIDAAADEERNGRNRLRQCILALRAFCERAWAQTSTRSHSGAGSQAARPATIEKVRSLVNAQEGWGGWPSDMEMKRTKNDRLWRRLRSVRFS